VSRNFLTGTIPEAIGNLGSLENLWIERNEIIGPIPSSIGNARNLEALYLSGNFDLNGTLPDSLFDIPYLVELNLFDCRLSGTLSSAVGQLKYLEHLILSRNNFRGTLPESLSELESLVKFWIDGNSFSGSVPASFCSSVRPSVKTKADCAPADGSGEIELQCDCCRVCCKPDGTECMPTKPWRGRQWRKLEGGRRRPRSSARRISDRRLIGRRFLRNQST